MASVRPKLGEYDRGLMSWGILSGEGLFWRREDDLRRRLKPRD